MIADCGERSVDLPTKGDERLLNRPRTDNVKPFPPTAFRQATTYSPKNSLKLGEKQGLIPLVCYAKLLGWFVVKTKII